MDGTTAGNGPGPRHRIPVVKDLMLASSDPVALDAVALKLMGIEPSGVEAIRLAHEDGLGVGDVREIEVVGADISAENWHFSTGDTVTRRALDLFRSSPLGRFERLVPPSAVQLLTAGSGVYHDQYRWHRHDRRTFERWQKETGWGRLFAGYGHGTRRRKVSASQART
jgi:hypothetical protein